MPTSVDHLGKPHILILLQGHLFERFSQTQPLCYLHVETFQSKVNNQFKMCWLAVVKVGQRFICEWCRSAIRNVVAVAKFVQVLYLFHLKSTRRKFLQDIYLEYFVIFGASWLKLGTYTTQPSQSCMELVIVVKYACCCQNVAALRIESFLCNQSINAVLTGLNSTRQRIQIKFKAKIVNL